MSRRGFLSFSDEGLNVEDFDPKVPKKAIFTKKSLLWHKMHAVVTP